MQGSKWPIILLACGPGVVIVNYLGQVVFRADNLSLARWASPTNPKLGSGRTLIFLARKNRAKFGLTHLTRWA